MKILDYERSHFGCVYCLEFPNGMKYVGKTHDVGGRVSLYKRFGEGGKVNGAIKEFGIENVDMRILVRLEGMSKVDMELCLGILEIKYIREIDSVYPNGYNVSLGGELLGIPIKHLTTDADTIRSLMSGNKMLLEYDVEGNFVKEYDSISRFAYEKGYDEKRVRDYVDKNKVYKGKHILRTKRYDYIPERIEVDDIKVVERVKYKTVVEERVVVKQKDVTYSKVPIIVYDLNGDFVGEYESNNAACRALYSGVTYMPLGVYKMGYIAFKKTGDDYPKKIEGIEELKYKVTCEEYKPINELEDKPMLDASVLNAPSGHYGKHEKLRHNFAVNQFKLNGEFVAQYKCLRDASDETGIQYSQIYANVMGKTRKCKGYIFQRADDEDKNEEFAVVDEPKKDISLF